MNGDLCDSRLAFTMPTSVFAKVSGYQSEGDVFFHTPCPFNHCPVAGCGQQLLAARVAEGLLGATGLFEGGLASLGVVEVNVPSAAAEVRINPSYLFISRNTIQELTEVGAPTCEVIPLWSNPTSLLAKKTLWFHGIIIHLHAHVYIYYIICIWLYTFLYAYIYIYICVCIYTIPILYIIVYSPRDIHPNISPLSVRSPNHRMLRTSASGRCSWT
jgi:hypothetical protein